MSSLRSISLKENSCFRRSGFLRNKNGQVWVETVLYTLIGLAVIGILLAVSKPKIEQMKDRMVIEQSIKALNEISTRIYDVQMAPGNKRTLDLKISKGKFYINATDNRIGWILESNHKYSEVGKVVNLGNMEVKTIEGNPYLVELSVQHNVNITVDGKKESVDKTPSSTVYKVIVENKGRVGGNINNIDLNVV